MARKSGGRYRKAKGPWRKVCETKVSDERKAYASKVRSLIEKKYRSLKQGRKSAVLRELLSSTYPKNVLKRSVSETQPDEESGFTSGEWNNCCDPDLEDVYESQKLNFRRMISNMSKNIYDVDSDFDSWSDLESNFSFIYEPSSVTTFYGQQRNCASVAGFRPWVEDTSADDDDDITLTLEKVKNLKNAAAGGGASCCSDNNNCRTLLDNQVDCDSCSSSSLCACSDVSSFLSTCTCCQTIRRRLVEANNVSSCCKFDSWTVSELSQMYEPISAEQMLWSSRIRQLKQKLRASTLSKASVDNSWDSWSLYANSSSIPLAISSKERRMRELFARLKDDCSDLGSQDSISVRFIYVPMHQNNDPATSGVAAPPPGGPSSTDFCQADTGSNVSSSSSKVVPPVPPKKPSNLLRQMMMTTSMHDDDDDHGVDGQSDSDKTEEESDPLGSLESLIFEPKSAAVFPDAIGRNNKLKASISVSNFSNRSLSESSDSTLKTNDADNAGEVKSSTTSGVVTGSSKDSVVSLGNQVGSYWDWGKVKACKDSLDAGRQQSISKISWFSSSGEPAATRVAAAECDYLCASELMKSSLTSESKTCAGTSVASWVYIGLQENKDPVASNVDNVVVEEDSAQHVTEEEEEPKRSSALPKKAVTWKMISERNSESVVDVTETKLTLPQLTELYNNWSDLESVIFASEYSSSTLTSLKSIVGHQVASALMAGTCRNNRMSCYHRNDWLYWDQQRKQRKMALPSWEQTWRNKARRMFLWMHYSQEVGGIPVEQWSWWKAKQRASILWLICKANNNKVPDDLKDPYYKDHDDQDQLKPLIVHALASAEYYCLALGNIYSDPNYHNLNHWGVIQALARKGVYVAEPSDVSLTETVLIQTSPIRMSAHMAVIEAIMALYLKETVTVERIVNAVRRFVPVGGPIELPTDIEEALVFWINKVCVKMKHRIEDDMNITTPEVQKAKGAVMSKGVDISRVAVRSQSAYAKLQSVNRRSPDATLNSLESEKSFNANERVAPPIPLLQDLGDMSDGCCLAVVISYYCPVALPWQDICLNEPMSMADSLYNIQLVQKFCRDHLPNDPCFLTLEDLVYQHSSIRQNILVFLAELFYVFEVRPSKCVRGFASRPEVNSPEAAGLVRRNGHSGLVSSATKRSFHQPAVGTIPDLRNSYSHNSCADVNKMSSKNSASSQREPLLPRRQHSQHERAPERSKRCSYTDGVKGSSGTTNSMRRTHSMQEIDKNGVDVPNTSGHDFKDCSESNYYISGPQSTVAYSQRLSSDKENHDQAVYEDASDLYLRPLPSSNLEGDPLMPAIIRPAKEKTNKVSKPEELGESVSQVQSQFAANNRSKGLTHVKRRSPPPPQSSDELRWQNAAPVLSEGSKHVSELPDISGFNQKNNDKSLEYDFPDNREIEEQIRSELCGPFPKPYKHNYLLMADECARLKEGLESMGSSESGVFVDRDISLKKEGLLPTTSFAQLSKLRDNVPGGGINIVYMQHDRDSDPDGAGHHMLKSSLLQRSKSEKGEKKASFAALPNQTTWQQQQQGNKHSSSQPDSGHETPSDGGITSEASLATHLCDVRLKLEEKRRRIEAEKKKMEVISGRMRQKVGKAAFLQAVTKGKESGSGNGTAEKGGQEEEEELESHSAESEATKPTGKDRHDHSRPDAAAAACDKYGSSIQQLNSNLSDLQSDIKRLTLKQEQIQSLMHDDAGYHQAPLDTQHFYLHEDRQLPPPGANSPWVNQRPLDSHLVQRSQSREQLYQTLQRSPSREKLYQPLQRSQSREQIYQPQQLQRTFSREQLYQPLQRSQSREQLYHLPLQRSPSHEYLYQPQTLMHVAAAAPPPPSQWAPQVPVDQHGYMEHQQGGYVLHSQPPSAYPVAHQYIPCGGGIPVYHNGFSVAAADVQYAQYPQSQHVLGSDGYAMTTHQSPFRLHVDVPPPSGMQQPLYHHHHHHHQGSMSRSQSPMLYHQSQPQPPSRPSSTPAFSVVGLPQASLPAKATPVAAPPESVMEPQSVHFIGSTEDLDGDRKPHSSLDHVVSGTATYRVRESGSPTRPALGKTFRVPKSRVLSPTSQDVKFGSPSPPPLLRESPQSSPVSAVPPLLPSKGGDDTDKGFFVSLDDEQPKRPKPPLRMKKVPKVMSKSEAGTPEREKPPEVFSHLAAASRTLGSGSDHHRLQCLDAIYDGSKVSPIGGGFEADGGGRVVDDLADVEVLSPVVKAESSAVGLVIGSGLVNPDPVGEEEMARRKEKILMSVIKRKEHQEELRAKKELEAARRREHERVKQELVERKKEDERARRQAILEQYRQRKAAMEEQEGGEKVEVPRTTTTLPKNKGKLMKPRPKSLHESALSAAENRAACRMGAAALAGAGSQANLVSDEASGFAGDYSCMDGDSHRLERGIPSRHAQSPGHQGSERLPTSPTSYGNACGLPPGLVSRRIGGLFSDTASDSCSTTSSTVEYTGPKLFKQPTAKSNRGIIVNAINAVLAGAVNADTKKRVLEEIARSDSKHFLILFRDAGCQFRALYSYSPEKEEVIKLMGTGPKQIMEKMMDKFFKYNCGGRSFTEIQTKHLTVTIDAFTIQNTLWQGKKVSAQKKDFF